MGRLPVGTNFFLELPERTGIVVSAIGLLIALRILAGAYLPLYYGDEPYYWVWSRHLAWGYYDHPPAVALLVRAGTALFGDNPFGVRSLGLLLSVPISLCVWRTGSLLIGEGKHGACAALLFNLTLMANVQTFLATPDAPAVACSAAFLWALAELAASRNGRWWLAAGVFGGLGLLSKYTVLFVGAGAMVWVLAIKEQRAWLATPWPWIGGAIAALVFAPNFVWNAHHGWGTFAFQFGRVGKSHHGWWYLPQFVAEQLILASPIIFVMAAHGVWLATRSLHPRRFLLAALVWPAILYFVVHALHDRVHRNWISVIYPALAVAAAHVYSLPEGRTRWRAAAIPVAVLLLVATYAEAFFQIVPVAAIDPLKQHLASDAKASAAPVLQALRLAGGRTIVTTGWETTAWLKFNLPPDTGIIQATEEFRFPDSPRPTAADLAAPLVYVSLKDSVPESLKARFTSIDPLASVLPAGAALPATPFRFFRLTGFHGEPFGRMP